MKKLLQAIVIILPLLTLFSFLSVSAYATNGNNMYRLYNPNSGEHFYTADSGEKDSLIHTGWKYEGIGWIAPKTGTPVYRLYNRSAGDHHYTTSVTERNNLIHAGWKSEGVGWYSGGSVALYRQYNPNAKTGTHNYTTNKDENNSLVRAGWRAEGIGWYGIGQGTAKPAVASKTASVSNYTRDQILDKIITHYTALWQPDGTYNFSEGTVNTKNGFYGNMRLARNTHGAVNPGFSANVIVTRIYVNTTTGYIYDADGYGEGWYIT